jgi:hypothetical protein
MSIGTTPEPIRMSLGSIVMTLPRIGTGRARTCITPASIDVGPVPTVRSSLFTHLHSHKEVCMEFPRSEADIAALAELVVQGLEQAADDFPSPPVPAPDLRAKITAVQEARAAAVNAESAFKEQHAHKDEVIEDLVDSLKANLKYAEFAVRDEPEKLSKLGWGLRRDGTPLQPPGEVRDIAIKAEGDNWVILQWKKPVDGGAPGVYRIQRRRDGTPWEDIGISTDLEELCSNQPEGVELYFRVFAVNKAGTGHPSATAAVVL